jgi:hypothetical protein
VWSCRFGEDPLGQAAKAGFAGLQSGCPLQDGALQRIVLRFQDLLKQAARLEGRQVQDFGDEALQIPARMQYLPQAVLLRRFGGVCTGSLSQVFSAVPWRRVP